MQSQRLQMGQCHRKNGLAPSHTTFASVNPAAHPSARVRDSRRRAYANASLPQAFVSAPMELQGATGSRTPVQPDLQPCCSSGRSNASPIADCVSFLFKLSEVNIRCFQRACRRYHRNLRAGAFQSQLLAMGVLVPTLPGPDPVADMLANRVLMTGFWAWFLAQFGKIFTKRFKKGVWDMGAMVEPGGMPSSHSSLCSGVTTAIAFSQGLGSPLFAVALAFSVIVMYDAMGVRRHAGKQAEVLNQVVNELMEDHPVYETKLKEVLGHTPRQVICGAILGVIVGVLYPSVIAMI